jgi:hypothetical protein
MVSVAIWVEEMSANTFDLHQAAQAEECDVLGHNQENRYCFKIAEKPPLVLETR